MFSELIGEPFDGDWDRNGKCFGSSCLRREKSNCELSVWNCLITALVPWVQPSQAVVCFKPPVKPGLMLLDMT
jgi:hypothetical protein